MQSDVLDALRRLLEAVTVREPYWFHLKGEERYYEAEVPESIVEQARAVLAAAAPENTDSEAE